MQGDRVWLHRVFPGTERAGTNKAFYWPFHAAEFEITENISAQHVRVRKATPPGGKIARSQVVHTRRLKHFHTQHDAFDFRDLNIVVDALDCADLDTPR